MSLEKMNAVLAKIFEYGPSVAKEAESKEEKPAKTKTKKAKTEKKPKK